MSVKQPHGKRLRSHSERPLKPLVTYQIGDRVRVDYPPDRKPYDGVIVEAWHESASQWRVRDGWDETHVVHNQYLTKVGE